MPLSRKKDFTGPAMVFVTTTIIDWIPILADKKCAEIMINQLYETSIMMRVSVVGYVIMPSHVHFIIGLRNINDLSKFMKAFKGLTSRELKRIDFIKSNPHFCRNDKFIIWKRRFDDLIIYSQKQHKIKLEYIHNNPVKDGLVAEAIEWPFSSARDWLSDFDGPVPIDKIYSWLD